MGSFEGVDSVMFALSFIKMESKRHKTPILSDSSTVRATHIYIVWICAEQRQFCLRIGCAICLFWLYFCLIPLEIIYNPHDASKFTTEVGTEWKKRDRHLQTRWQRSSSFKSHVNIWMRFYIGGVVQTPGSMKVHINFWKCV